MGSKWQRVLLVIDAVLLSCLVVTTGASIWLGEQTVHLARNAVPATSSFESMIASIPHQPIAEVKVKAQDERHYKAGSSNRPHRKAQASCSCTVWATTAQA